MLFFLLLFGLVFGVLWVFVWFVFFMFDLKLRVIFAEVAGKFVLKANKRLPV